MSDIDLTKRWESGKPHHPDAEKLARLIGEFDFEHNGDSFCFKFGGDGDNGESLCFILSEIFERGMFRAPHPAVEVLSELETWLAETPSKYDVEILSLVRELRKKHGI